MHLHTVLHWLLLPSLMWELGFHMPCGQKTKTKNRNNIVTNSAKIPKMIHIPKKKKNLKNKMNKMLTLFLQAQGLTLRMTLAPLK